MNDTGRRESTGGLIYWITGGILCISVISGVFFYYYYQKRRMAWKEMRREIDELVTNRKPETAAKRLEEMESKLPHKYVESLRESVRKAKNKKLFEENDARTDARGLAEYVGTRVKRSVDSHANHP